MSFVITDNMSSVSTMSNSASATPSTSTANQVPSNLVPTTLKNIDFAHAQKTKNWACMFDRQQFQSLYENENDRELLLKWQQYMIKMQEELQTIGYEHARKEIVRLFVYQYEICDPVTKEYPKLFTDVLKIIENPSWYKKNLVKSRNTVYMCIYGITRRNMDRWLQDVANKWRASKNIVEFGATQVRSSNGFVHKNMVQKASTLIQRRIKAIMWNFHKEEICCKRKLKKERTDLCETKLLCHGFIAYLYTPAGPENALQQIQQSVLHALQLQIPQQIIMQTVQTLMQQHHLTTSNDKNKGKYI